MRVRVLIDGKTYTSSETDEISAKDAWQTHYDRIGEGQAGKTTLRMELDGGEFLVMGSEMCKKAIFFYLP